VVLSFLAVTALLGCAEDDGRGLGDNAGPWQDDDRGVGQPGPVLGSFELTFYWIASESSYVGAKDTRIYTKSCQAIADVPRKFFDALKLEGTGKLNDGRMLNYAGSCNCARSPCFEVLGADAPWGKGVQNRSLEPFRSIAVDKSRIPYGDWVYVEALDGLEMPGDAPWGDFVHDGCLRADDTGSAIVGKHIDFFAAFKSHYQTLVGEIDDHVEVRAAGDRCPVIGVEDPEEDPEDPIDEDPDVAQVCYPGPANDFSVCLPLSFPGQPTGYKYPAPLSTNYRAPIAYLDLQAIPSDTKLAANFTLGEFASIAKGRWAVVQPHAVARMQTLRDILGAVKVNSGYRSPQYNSSVGGASSSRHMFGDGFDYDPVTATLTKGEQACTGNGGTLIEYTSHVHCDWRKTPVDPLFYGAVAVAEEPDLALTSMAAELEEVDGIWTAPAIGFDEGEPRRRWTATDRDGNVVATAEGESFVPPADAVRIEVDVGRVVVLAHDL